MKHNIFVIVGPLSDAEVGRNYFRVGGAVYVVLLLAHGDSEAFVVLLCTLRGVEGKGVGATNLAT